MSHQVSRFIVVGCAAAAVHLLVVALLVSAWSVAPIWANPVGFVVAFFVSFAGHARWTFPIEPAMRGRARQRFFVIALAGFLLNQALFASGLKHVEPRAYLLLLTAVTLAVAGSTFVLARLWAFARPIDQGGDQGIATS